MRRKVNSGQPRLAVKGIAPLRSSPLSKALTSVKLGLVKIQAGILLTCSLASIAYLLRLVPGLNLFSPLILAILLGILVRNALGTPVHCQAGISFAMKRILRFAVVLLGIQLNFLQVLSVGFTGLFIIVTTLLSTFWFTCWLGKRLGIQAGLTHLIAAGTSICGASAVIATSTATESSDEDVAYSVAIVTLFGTLSMLLYPLLSGQLQLTPEAFGLWCGVSIHEVAQVIAAAFQASPISGEIASISKLSRVLWLAPMILMVGILSKGTEPQRKAQVTIPWFIIYFMLLVLLNSLNIFPQGFKTIIGQINQVLLTIAMAAMGLETKLNQIQRIGVKPLYLGALSWLFISILSYGLIEFFY